MDYIIKRASTLSVEEQTAKGITGIPQDWPIEKYPYIDNVPEGFEQISEENLETLIENNQAAYDAWLQSLRPIIQPVSLTQDVNVMNEPRIEYTSKYFAKGDATMVSCPANTTTYIDLLVNNKTAESAILTNEAYTSKYLRGGEVFGTNIQFGDYCEFQVIDKDGWLVASGQMNQQTFDYLKSVSGVGGIILKQYYYKRYIYPNDKNILKSETPGQIPVGVYLRAVYHAIAAGETREIIINYDIENKD